MPQFQFIRGHSENCAEDRRDPTSAFAVLGGFDMPVVVQRLSVQAALEFHSCTAEDLRPVSEVEAGVNFRPAGGVRRQVVGSFSGQQPGTGTRKCKGSVVTPSLHPEVPDSLSVSPWTWQENQAIDGLDEGVWDRTIGDLVAKG